MGAEPLLDIYRRVFIAGLDRKEIMIDELYSLAERMRDDGNLEERRIAACLFVIHGAYKQGTGYLHRIYRLCLEFAEANMGGLN